jgi:hypothetical protein
MAFYISTINAEAQQAVNESSRQSVIAGEGWQLDPSVL